MSTPATLQFGGLEASARFEHAAMATSFVFHLFGDTEDAATLRSAAAEAFHLIDRIEDRLSFYREGSEVSRINRAREGETLRISEDTLTCLMTALEVSSASSGAFDPFAGAPALVAKGQPVPAHLFGEVADDPPGTACLAVDPESFTVTKLAGRRWLDLGAVGKGHALDAAAELLLEWGVTSGLLVAGGSSVLAFGPGPGERETWPLTLNSVDGRRTLRLNAPFAVGASGEGFQPGHLVRTRAAVDSSPSPRRTYTLAPTAALADALSTALWLVRADERPALAKPWPTVAFLVEPNTPSAPAVSSGVFAEETPSTPDCLLVIPCWRESRRLPRFLPALCEAITAHALQVEMQVSDDGSPEAEFSATAACVDRMRSRYACLRPITRLAEHRGKGAAILHGWSQAAAGTRWLAFVDADGSVPAEEVSRLIAAALGRSSADVVVASNRRHHDPAHPVRRLRRRKWVGTAFARWSRWRLRHDADDPQCGCKVVPASLVRGYQWSEMEYGLDLELLVMARRAQIDVLNIPIAWEEMPASRLRLKDLLKMLQTIERLRITSRASTGPVPASSPPTP